MKFLDEDKTLRSTKQTNVTMDKNIKHMEYFCIMCGKYNVAKKMISNSNSIFLLKISTRYWNLSAELVTRVWDVGKLEYKKLLFPIWCNLSPKVTMKNAVFS